MTKVKFILIWYFCLGLISHAQTPQEKAIITFEDSSEFSSSFWEIENSPGDGNKINYYPVDNPVAMGNQAMRIDWSVQDTLSWGGFTHLMHWKPENQLYDFSLYDSISFYYYIISPASLPEESVEFRLMLVDVSNGLHGDSTMDMNEAEIYFSFHPILRDAPGWNRISIPLYSDTLYDGYHNEENHFFLTDWIGIQGNQILDRDKIKAIILECNIFGTSTLVTVNGSLCIDHIYLKSASDSSALVALYDSLDGDYWLNSTNWKTDNPIDTWYGISVENGRVTEIELTDNFLVGTIPHQIGILDKLVKLDLHNNTIMDHLPSEMGRLTDLTNLRISQNHLSGYLPEWIGNLVNLSTLDLSENSLSGSFPVNLLKLINLDSLYLHGNQFTGTIPGTITDLEHLKVFNISENQITDLPNMTSISNLNILSVQNNRLTFEDIEANVGIDSFVYAPQDCVGLAKDTMAIVGDRFSYEIFVGGENNFYQWYKNNIPLLGATSSTLFISSILPEDAGNYILHTTNSLATDLTLLSYVLRLYLPQPPDILSSDFSDIRVTTARLNAMVDPNILQTQVYFEYGPTTSLGEDTQSYSDTLWGNIYQEVSTYIKNLSINTTYYFRPVAVSAMGIQYGSIHSFTTCNYQIEGNVIAFTIDYLPQKNYKEAYTSSDYRLIGLPGSSVIPMSEIMPGNTDNDWYAYWDNGNTNGYKIAYDGSNKFDFSLGKSIWVICMQNINISEIVAMPQLNNEDEISIPLRPGWNLITNPYTATVDWTEVIIRNGNPDYPLDFLLWEWTGGWNHPMNMEPFKGYMFNNHNNLTDLKIPFPVANSKMKEFRTIFEWVINIQMKSKDFNESALHFGIIPGSEFAKDNYDYHKPLMFNALPGAVFKREEWDEKKPDFATDFRPEIGNIQSWPMTAILPLYEKVDFYFEGIDSIPDEHDVILVDRQLRTSHDLKEDPYYRLTSPVPKREFEILVGDPDEIEIMLKDLVVSEFLLGPNFPNPFNPSTVIPLEIAEMTHVELSIYDIMGRKIKTIQSGTLNQGRHLLTWDGKNISGARVASGVYLYRVKTGNGFQAVRKMILMK